MLVEQQIQRMTTIFLCSYFLATTRQRLDDTRKTSLYRNHLTLSNPLDVQTHRFKFEELYLVSMETSYLHSRT